MTMRLFYEAMWIQKAGSPEEEYEDAFWPSRSVSGESRQKETFAIADGATESSFSGVWAKQLVRAYCRGRIDPLRTNTSLLPKQRGWSRFVGRKPLPWYAEEKIRNGTFSTILGLTLDAGSENGRSGAWNAFAVGDSCLVHIRDEEILSTFPLSNAAEFNNSPFLLGSNPESNKDIEIHIQTAKGRWESEDTFYLMTDALAAWFVREVEDNGTPWRSLRDLNRDLPFRPWIEDLRTKKQIRNDDVTLYRIEIE
jgi:Protein phosphatase 2C